MSDKSDYPHLSLENLMICLLEEASEAVQAMSKAKRFGLDAFPPDIEGAVTNRTKIAFELGDLIGVVNLISREHLSSDANALILEISLKKEERIRRFFKEGFYR